ncbi:MAG: 30S ribosomal protein S8 [Candidatus Margulisbacteria bacterium]|nr:30S ribosomal protein S8 [Candidatus Margulisiibacteriota bacterium]
MSVTDPIADMICILKNAWRVKKEIVIIPFSNIKKEIVKLMKEEGYISQFEIQEDKAKKSIKVYLKYDDNGQSVITDMIRRSTPGKRDYTQKSKIDKVKNGFGVSILSTNKGLLTGKQARINNVGGEVLCYIW